MGMNRFVCPNCRASLRYLFEFAEFVRPFRLYASGKRVRAGPYEEDISFFACPKCCFTSEYTHAFRGFTRYSGETIGYGWAIMPFLSGDEAEVSVIDFCTSRAAVMVMVREGGYPGWRCERMSIRRIVDASAYIMRYPARTVLILEAEVGGEVSLQEIGGLAGAVMTMRRMRRIGRIRIETRRGGQAKEVEIDARKGTVRAIERGQETRARIGRVWRESRADVHRTYESVLMELVPVTEAVEG